ncbi:MAG: anti-sigma factor domain-containing protein [Fluviicola sp.]
MDIKEYIASGIIDSYVLGAVSEQERQEVQCMSKIYPEIREELRIAEEAMERYAQSIAKDPPASVKVSVLEKIAATPQEKEVPIVPLTPTSEANDAKGEENRQTPIRVLPAAYKWGAVASVFIIIAVSLLYFNATSEANKLSGELTALKKETTDKQENFESELNQMQLAMQSIQEREDFINAPETQKLLLKGTEVRPDANATVYFDSKQGSALLASSGLPSPKEGKQYQLWVIADGQPIDLGVLDKNSTFSSKIAVNTSDIQAFAITLEPEGGSKVPTLEKLYVIGNV